MDPTVVGLASLGALVVLLAAGIHIGWAMALIGFLGVWVLKGPVAGLSMLALMPYATAASFLLVVVPLFILMGYLILHAGIAQDLFDAGFKWVGRLPGGLGIAAIFGCALFAAACGATVATAMAIGRVAVPEMRRFGYDKGFAAACVAAGGTLGVLIPPSIPMVIYGGLTGVSIGKLLIAGFIPGVIGAIAYSLVILVRARMNPQLAPAGPTFPWKERFVSLKGVWGIVVLMIVVMGSIYMGVATPTEAGALGAFGAFVLLFITRKFSRQSVGSSLMDTGRTTTVIFAILIGAFIYSRFLGLAGLPLDLSEWIAEAGLPPLALLAMVVALFVFLGMFIDPISMQVLAVPLVFPAITAAGFDGIWFGIIVVRMVEIATLTPPLGFNVFAMASIVPDVASTAIFRNVTFFILVDILTVALFTAFPIIVLFLPNLMK